MTCNMQYQNQILNRECRLTLRRRQILHGIKYDHPIAAYSRLFIHEGAAQAFRSMHLSSRENGGVAARDESTRA